MATLELTNAPGVMPVQSDTVPPTTALQSPSAEIVYDNFKPFTVVDERGRTFTCAKPALLRDLNFIEMMGDTAKNIVYMSMVSPLKWIQSIDGDPVTFRTRREWDALVKVVDNDGLNALFIAFLQRGIIQLPKDEEGEADMAKAAAEAKEQLKNS